MYEQLFYKTTTTTKIPTVLLRTPELQGVLDRGMAHRLHLYCQFQEERLQEGVSLSVAPRGARSEGATLWPLGRSKNVLSKLDISESKRGVNYFVINL